MQIISTSQLSEKFKRHGTGWAIHIRRIANTCRNEWSYVKTNKFPMTFLLPLHIWKSCTDAEVDNEDDDVLCGFNDNTIR